MKSKIKTPGVVLALVLVSCVLQNTNAAKILFFMGAASHSHRVALQPLAVKLAEVGHKVTFLTHIKSETMNENITEFFPESVAKLMAGVSDDYSVKVIQRKLKEKYYDPFLEPQTIWDVTLDPLEMLVLDEDFQHWLNSSHFDLIIYDNPLKEIAFGIAYKMNAKVIAFVTTASPFMFDFDMYGLPVESSWLPDWTAGSQYSLIPHHFVYTYNAIWWYFSYKWNYLPKIDEILAKLYGENLPPVEELIRKTDLVFVNGHFSSTFPRSLPPFVVPVGGMHCKESKGVLPQEMEAFLKTKERFVFISFGSAVKVSALPAEAQQMLFDTLESIEDTNFLLKWEGEIPKNLPKNAFAHKWFPQQDVLAHPKCKGFVSQGGAMSFQQAAFHGVPMIIVPIWADQNYVGYSVVYQGNGILLELADINKQTLTKAFRDILDNGDYSKNAKEISRRFKDRPMSAVDTGVWWTEYVLRHDTAHLKSPGIQQYWWQRRLLDFWATVFVAIFLSGLASAKLLLMLVKKVLCVAKNSHSEKLKKS